MGIHVHAYMYFAPLRHDSFIIQQHVICKSFIRTTACYLQNVDSFSDKYIVRAINLDVLYGQVLLELWDLKDVMAANKRRKVQDKAARAEKRMQDMEAHDAEEASLVEQVGGLTI